MNENREPTEQKKLLIPKIALIFEGTGILAALLASTDAGLENLVIFLFLWLWVVATAIIGMLLGLLSLFIRRKTKTDLFCAIAAILLPPFAVLFIIFLASVGVVVIRFM